MQGLYEEIDVGKSKTVKSGTDWMISKIPAEWDYKKLKEVVKFRQGLQIS